MRYLTKFTRETAPQKYFEYECIHGISNTYNILKNCYVVTVTVEHIFGSFSVMFVLWFKGVPGLKINDLHFLYNVYY